MSRKPARAGTLQGKYEILLRRLAAELKSFYGPRLVSIVIFGSVGRGTPREDSDVDVLIIADKLPDGRLNRVDEFAAVKKALMADLHALEAEGVFTSLAPVFKTPAEVKRGSLLFLDMIDDGCILYDRSGFWRAYLRDFKRRLRRLGARKVIDGDRWYWDLKPDYKVGEIFEI